MFVSSIVIQKYASLYDLSLGLTTDFMQEKLQKH